MVELVGLGWLNFYEEVLKLQVIFSGGQGVKILDCIEVNPEILHGKPILLEPGFL